jgi:hypothetical protein
MFEVGETKNFCLILLSRLLKSGVIPRYRLFNVKTSKSPHAILDVNEERRKW